MTIKQIKQSLDVAFAAALLFALVVLAWGVLLPVRVSESAVGDTGLSAAQQSGSPRTAEQRGPSLAELSVVSAIDLRRPLQDAPPAIIAAVPMQARLMGTVYQPANPEESLALFRLADGSERLLKAGDVFSDPAGQVTVTRVAEQAVTIQLQGQQQELFTANP